MDIENHLWLMIVLAIVLCIVLAWGVGKLRQRQHVRLIFDALRDSCHGQVVVQHRPNTTEFIAEVRPAPDPFSRLTVRYLCGTNPLTLDLIFPTARYPNNTLLFQGVLLDRPTAELVWLRGQIPTRALGKGPGSRQWSFPRLDFVNAEYAVRGAHPGALEHAFSDLHTRFGPLLRHVHIRLDEQPEVEIALYGARLNVEEIPALVAVIRAAGRAAIQG